ncbi:ribosomal protein S18 acetylase RimI-like enzyme [Paucibacter oligotrophus]|uniref:Ribosomal protein S18 acetylase RimI-like enzyme n=1 Tax=Roseateles oligotrophus TaxID=1769250 RepID=A0A840L8N5_9BURK|nr:GNAT family N-acetyltransferase [Roseateles oligotrophus]MBB4843123.1 ribosomal protein S18 acetylase RimI-like enzyme [Roseateles oligotrophus]
MTPPEIAIVTPSTPEEWGLVREMLCDYQASLSVHLGFQDFEQELLDLPGQYAEPSGGFLLALVDGAVAGCGGFRNLPEVDYPNACEMKRLYVRPAFRRFGLGRVLAQGLLDAATQAGYSSMLLDTLDDMEAARGLYESLGFEAVPPYYFNPIAGAHYLKVELA